MGAIIDFKQIEYEDEFGLNDAGDKCLKCDWVWSEDHPCHTHGGQPVFAVMYSGSEGIYTTKMSRYAAQREADRQNAKSGGKFKYWVEDWS